MSPLDCAGAPNPRIMQSDSGEGLKVKNTFIDDWVTDESADCAGRPRTAGRAARTCPAFTGNRSEPESEPAPPGPPHEPAPEAPPGAPSPEAAPVLRPQRETWDLVEAPDLRRATLGGPGNPFCLTPSAGAPKTPRAGAPKRVRFASSAEEFVCAAGSAQPSAGLVEATGALGGQPRWAPSPVCSEEAVEFLWPGAQLPSPAGSSEESWAASPIASGVASQPAPTGPPLASAEAAGAHAPGRRRRRGGSRRAAAAAGTRDARVGEATQSGPRAAPASGAAQALEGAQRSPPGGGRREVAQRGSRASKLWCHLFLDECMLAGGFDLAKKIIGHGGSGTRGIFSATGAKIRLRGRGSGHLENGREAPVPLMLAVTTGIKESDSFRRAMQMASDHLRGVEEKFKGFCRRSQLPLPARCYWVGEISEGGTACLGGVLESCRLATVQRPGGAAGR